MMDDGAGPMRTASGARRPNGTPLRVSCQSRGRAPQGRDLICDQPQRATFVGETKTRSGECIRPPSRSQRAVRLSCKAYLTGIHHLHTPPAALATALDLLLACPSACSRLSRTAANGRSDLFRVLFIRYPSDTWPPPSGSRQRSSKVADPLFRLDRRFLLDQAAAAAFACTSACSSRPADESEPDANLEPIA